MGNSLELSKNKLIGPVAIGGVGGSGTRIVAELLQKMGIYLGNDLNFANDNLLFTLLFKDPKWFMLNSNEKPFEIYKRFNLFKKVMLGNLNLSDKNEIKVIISVIVFKSLYVRDKSNIRQRIWPYNRLLKILKRNINLSCYTGWGWKEPNSHIYIKHLCDYFPNLKYIHVIRHGLDMAYSNN